MITIRNSASSTRLCTSFTEEPLEDMGSMSAMPTGLAKDECVVNGVWVSSTNKLRSCGIQLGLAYLASARYNVRVVRCAWCQV